MQEDSWLVLLCVLRTREGLLVLALGLRLTKQAQRKGFRLCNVEHLKALVLKLAEKLSVFECLLPPLLELLILYPLEPVVSVGSNIG